MLRVYLGDMTLIEFLVARFAEDEATAKHIGDLLSAGRPVGDGPFDPDRVLAECEAKRRIVAAAQRNPNAPLDAYAIGRSDLSRQVLHALALPYAGHPDYRPEWRP